MISKDLIKTKLLLALFWILSWPLQGQHKIVGYLPNFADYSAVMPTIHFDKLTHINIAFENADTAGNLSFNPANTELIQLAHANKVKVLVSIGGGAVSSNPDLYSHYFNLIRDGQRAGFVTKIAAYLTAHQLDGIDIDLEGPAINADYGKFITDLSRVLRPKGLLLTAALTFANGGEAVPVSVYPDFDFINIMAYDATGPWAPTRAGQHASLEFAKTSMEEWIKRGLPKHKAVLGLPFYGYGFGPDFNQGIGFAQILKQFPGSENQDEVGNTIYYNGIPTISAKAELVVAQQYGGIMIWQLAQDAAGENSLLQVIHQILNKGTGTAAKSTAAVNIYMNPGTARGQSAGYVVFPETTDKIKINIRNPEGKKVFGKTYRNKQRQGRIDLPGLPPGNYSIQVKADKLLHSNKFRID